MAEISSNHRTVVVGEVIEAGLKNEAEPLTLKEIGAKYGG